MNVAEIQFMPWDKSYYFSHDGISLAKGDRVIVKTEMGMEMGEVMGLTDVESEEFKNFKKEREQKTANDGRTGGNEGKGEDDDANELIKPIVRKATVSDLDKIPSAEDKSRALNYAISSKERLNLPMKIIDVHFAFDGSRVTFAFIADGRVDFRDMVKDLTRYLGRTIRLQQIGIRDEAKIMGDYGHCGRGLCCRGHLKNLESITSEMAELQQCSHRGSDRISGVCGRLMCCLAYEQKGYEEISEKFPPIGSEVKIQGKRGRIIGYHTLKKTVNVEFFSNNGNGDSTIAEVDLRAKKILK